MLSQKFLAIQRAKFLRLCLGNSSSFYTRHSKVLAKCHLSITTSSCHSLANSTNDLLCQENRSNSWNDDSKQKQKFDFRIGSFISAFIIFLLGFKEAFCDPPVQESSNDSSSTNTSSNKSFDSNPEQVEKAEDISKAIPELPNRSSSTNESKKSLPSSPNSKLKGPLLSNSVRSLKSAITQSRGYLDCKISESGAPGISIAVSVNGKLLWSEGVGLADVENGLRMYSSSVMRIASISKSLTMVAICQLIEEGKLDLDAPVQKYVPYFPKKFVDGEEVTITTRQLLNHTSGVRHYDLKIEEEKRKKKEKKEKEEAAEEEDEEEEGETGKDGNPLWKLKKKRLAYAKLLSRLAMRPQIEASEEDEPGLDEVYIKETFKDTREAIKLFEDDELLFKPGEDFRYSTHAYSLVSAVIEGASGKKFADVMTKLFKELGMERTTLDRHDPIIIRRARMYRRDKQGKLNNAPYVDNSYKWAGGGFLSNVIDLANFGNVMLYSYQNTDDQEPRGFLKSSTVRDIWKQSPNTRMNWDPDGAYGLGWGVVHEQQHPKAFARRQRFYVSHTGGAIGASSVVLVMPTRELSETETETESEGDGTSRKTALPQGVVVAVIVNLQDVGLNAIALEIAKLFEQVQQEETGVVGTIGGNTKHKIYSLNTS